MGKVSDLGPKIRGFKPGREGGFLRSIEIRRTPSFVEEVKPENSCHKALRHVKKNHLGSMNKNTSKGQNSSFLSALPPACY
jgi:hypothetical protein